MNQKNIFLIGICVLLLITFKVNSQDIYQPTKVVPASPTAASLGVYGDLPVSYHTGTPNIGIPVYVIKTNNHSLPISINYNATGIKINQDASWVGLGWSLSAGGVITRTIRGKDDFLPDGYANSPVLPPSDAADNYQGFNNGSDNTYFENIFKNYVDGEPDIFFFNFAGITGSFVMDKVVNGATVFVQEQNNIKVEYNSTQSTWTLTTADGYKYYFDTKETSETFSTSSQVIQYTGISTFSPSMEGPSTNSWYLDKITSPEGEEINFEYEQGRSLSAISRSQTRYDNISVYQDNGALAAVYNYFVSSRQLTNDIYLRKISFKNGYLQFNRSTRTDIEPYGPLTSMYPAKLDNIKLYNPANEVIKEFKLESSYFNETYSVPVDFVAYRRLKLDALKEFGVGGDVPGAIYGKYEFGYKDPDLLPGKYSLKYDKYGYFADFSPTTLDGELQPTLLPPASVTTTLPVAVKNFPGTIRTPDQTGDIITMGMLTSIKYPTGGTTHFEFEPHDHPQYVTTSTTTRDTLSRIYADPEFPAESVTTKDFTLSTTTNVTFELRYYEVPWNEPIGAPYELSVWNPVYLKNKDNDQIIQSFSLTTLSGYTNTFQSTLGPGNYTILVSSMLDDYSTHLLATCCAQTTTESHWENPKGGGVRIKSMINLDEFGKIINQKKFSYIEEGLSTGRFLAKEPDYYTAEVYINISDGSTLFQGSGYYLARSSSNLYPAGFSTNGAILGYNKVTISEGDVNKFGKTEYSYNNESSNSGTYWNMIYPGTPQRGSTLNGKVNAITVRDKDDNIVKRTLFDYELKGSSVVKGLKSFVPLPMTNNVEWPGSNGGISLVQNIFYSNISEWWVLSNQTEENYSDGHVATVNMKNYYNNSVHKQITSQEVSQSDGTVVTTVFKYPHDFTSIYPYQEMVNNKYMIAPVIEKWKYRGTQPLEAVKTTYNNWGGGLYAPFTISSARGGGGFETRVKVYGYDANGNVLADAKENDLINSYVWGYNKTFPVLKAENVETTELNQKVGLVLNEMGYTTGLAAMDNFLASLGALASPSEKNIWITFNNKLREKFNAQKVKILSYAYLPLNGVTSTSDEKGLLVFYEYDFMGRLALVRDMDGNIIKLYEYNLRK